MRKVDWVYILHFSCATHVNSYSFQACKLFQRVLFYTFVLCKIQSIYLVWSQHYMYLLVTIGTVQRRYLEYLLSKIDTQQWLWFNTGTTRYAIFGTAAYGSIDCLDLLFDPNFLDPRMFSGLHLLFRCIIFSNTVYKFKI